MNDYGIITAIETATGSLTYPFKNTGNIGKDGYEIVLAPNQTNLTLAVSTMDSNMNLLGILAINWREGLDGDAVYGATMFTDGGLFFQPNSHSIDVFDGRTGAFRSSISLPITLSSAYRALVIDGKDNVQIAITTNGDSIAVIDLGSMPKPPPIAHLVRPQAAASPNTNSWESRSPTQWSRYRKAPSAVGTTPRHRIVHLMQSAPSR